MVLHEIQKDVKPLTLQWNLCATRIHGQMECLSKTLALSTKPILRACKFFFELLSDENHTGDRIVWLAALRCIHGKHSRRVGTITQMLRNLSKYLCYLTEHGKSCHQSSILSVNFWVIPTSPRKDVLTLILSKKRIEIWQRWKSPSGQQITTVKPNVAWGRWYPSMGHERPVV